MSGTCAVVVTYRPNSQVATNLLALRPQVEHIVIVDNSSPEGDLVELQQIVSQGDSTLLQNRRNLGVAAALNLGIQCAKTNGFAFVVLFDQDSTVPPGFVAALLKTYQEHPKRESIAIVTSRQLDRGVGRVLDLALLEDGGPLTAITSGSLLPVHVFAECSGFEEDLFIDWVDFEFCLRVRQAGYLIALCEEAVLLVNIGAATEHRVLGHSLRATNHSARRRYYMTRNRMVMTARWARHYPRWALHSLRDFALETLAVALYEQERGRKLLNTARGLRDACLGRMGKVVEI